MNVNQWGSSFAKYLKKILDGEKKIDIQRHILGSIKDFEPYAAFMRLDRNNKKYITIDDLNMFLREMNARFSEINLRSVMRFYDQDRDNCLNYEEFLKLVSTNCDNQLRAEITQRPNYPVNKNDYLAYEIEENLVLLILKEIEFIKEMQYKASSFTLFNGVNYTDIFRHIDYLNYGYINGHELAAFLKENRYFVAETDINILIARLDINNDGVVTLEDFQEIFFTPSAKSFYFQEKDNLLNYNSQSSVDLNNRNNRLRGSVSLRASLQSYTSPKRERPGYNVMENSKDYANDNSKYSPVSDKSLYASTRFSNNLSNLSDGLHLDYRSKIDYASILVNYMIKSVELENNLQTIKESFCLKEFSLRALFSIFDPYNKGYATISDFQKGISLLNLFYTKEDLRLLFKRYDITRAGKLSFSEFTQMIAPQNNEYAKLLRNKFSDSLSQHERPTKEFSHFIKSLVETEYQIECLRKLSMNNPYFILSDAFDVLKYYSSLKSYINSFLKRHGVIFTDYQLDYVMERFDKNRDCRITQDEFLDELLPIN